MSEPLKDKISEEVSEQQKLLVPLVFSFHNNMTTSRSKMFAVSESTGSSIKSSESVDHKQPKIIECRVEFVTFGEVDTFNEQFKAHVLIRSRWFENEIITEYDPKTAWNPKLFVENAIPEKFYEEINYKLEQHEDRTEITEVRSCKGFEKFLVLFFVTVLSWKAVAKYRNKLFLIWLLIS